MYRRSKASKYILAIVIVSAMVSKQLKLLLVVLYLDS